VGLELLSLSDAERLLGALQQITHTSESVGRIEAALVTLGAQMSKANDDLQALKAQLGDTTSDVLAKIGQLEDQLGQLPEDAAATLADIRAGVEQLDATVGDADGSDTPAEPTL
jgi:hypothetical protein